MNHKEQISEFRRIWKARGRTLSEEEATEQFYRLYAFMRLIFKREHLHRNERYRALFDKQVADIINP